MRYGIVIQRASGDCSAYAPDLPGCVSTGKTVDETLANMREAIEFHLDGMRDDGLAVPPPTSLCEYVETN